MKKVWLLQIPRIDDITWGLKEVANRFEKNNFKTSIIDINRLIYKFFFKTKKWNDIENYGIMGKSKIPLLKISKIFFQAIKKIKKEDIVAFCVFSYESRPWALLFSSFLRKKFPYIIICYGGAGTRDIGETRLESQWGQQSLDLNFCDSVFLGESTSLIDEFCKDPKKNKGLLFKENFEFPNLGFLPKKYIKSNKDLFYYNSDYFYDGHDHNSFLTNKKVGIHFTRGCVKKCTFCDVPWTDTKWMMKSAENVIEEIDFYNKSTGIYNFYFADSTTNGSSSEFLKYLKLLYKWKIQNNISNLMWSCNFAVKPKHQIPEETYELLKLTNGKLRTGFDHVSDKVLDHMKKNYHWDDILSCIENCKKYGIKVGANWIVGYPTETEEDFTEYSKLLSVKGLENVLFYNNIIPCAIHRNSPLLRIVDIDWSDANNWTSKVTHNDKNIRKIRKTRLENMLSSISPILIQKVSNARLEI